MHNWCSMTSFIIVFAMAEASLKEKAGAWNRNLQLKLISRRRGERRGGEGDSHSDFLARRKEREREIFTSFVCWDDSVSGRLFNYFTQEVLIEKQAWVDMIIYWQFTKLLPLKCVIGKDYSAQGADHSRQWESLCYLKSSFHATDIIPQF